MVRQFSVVVAVLARIVAVGTVLGSAVSCTSDPAALRAAKDDGRPVVELQLGLQALQDDPMQWSAEPAAADWIVELAGCGDRDLAAVAADLFGPSDDWAVLRVYDQLQAIAVRATPAALGRLHGDVRVQSVTPDRLLRTQASAGDVVGATKARATLGTMGAGVRIAVVDTGVDGAHPDLAGRIVAQQCFCAAGCPGGGKQGPLATDPHGHGTHVASTLVGAGKLAPPGIAPEARLVAIRVFGQDGTGPTSDLLAGLNWLIGQAAVHKVRIVNLSLGSGELFAGTCDGADPVTAKALKLLKSKAMLVFAAAGNDAAQGKLATPACLSGAVAVGATYAGSYGAQAFGKLCKDAATSTAKVACFSNRAPKLQLVAPGAFLAGAIPGAKIATLAGTSQATPVAAGAAALLLGCHPGLSASQVQAFLTATGKPVVDKVNSQTFALVQAAAAAKAACPWLAGGVPGKS